MRLEAIEFIMEVVQCGSISAAARKVYTQQTTLSAAIKSAEKELGITIFSRQFDGVVLTEEGKAFLDLARPMLEAYHLMKGIGHPNDQMLTLHINSMLYSYFCADVLSELYLRFPELTTAIMETTPETLLETMKANSNTQIGIGFCSPERLEDHRQQANAFGFSFTPLLCTEMLVYVNQNNVLSVKESVKPDDLKNQHMILSAYCTNLFCELSLDKIVKNQTVLSFSTPAPLFNSVQYSNMVTLAPERKVIPKLVLSANDCTVPLHIEVDDSSGYYFQHYLVHSKKQSTSENEKAVIAFIREIFKP